MSASPPSSDRLLVSFDVFFRDPSLVGLLARKEPVEEVEAVPRLVENVGACRALIGSRP
jgi:hypothetical protein